MPLSRSATAWSAIFLLFAASGVAQAEDFDRFRYLMDLHAHVPSEAQLAALIQKADGDPGLVQELVDHPSFDAFLDRHHADMLWPSLDAGDLIDPAIAFLLPALPFRKQRRRRPLWTLHGVSGALQPGGGIVPCKDEPAQFDDSGDPIFEDMPYGTRREGSVLFEDSYWAPGETVKVCALAARLTPVANNGATCPPQGLISGDCGCGPNLQYCMSPDSAVVIEKSLRQQLLRMIKKPIKAGRPYYAALLDDHEQLNGALIHYYRYRVQMALDPIIQIPPVPAKVLPTDVPFTDVTWTAYKRSSEHSRILTSLAYLLRFMSSRSRANRFYNAFLCSPFQTPGTALPSPNDECSQEPDLRYEIGRRYFITGRLPVGLNARGSSLSALVANQWGGDRPVPHLACAVESYAQDLPAYAAAMPVASIGHMRYILRQYLGIPTPIGANMTDALAAYWAQSKPLDGASNSGLAAIYRDNRARPTERVKSTLYSQFEFDSAATSKVRDHYGFNPGRVERPLGRAALAAQALKSGLSRVVNVQLANKLDTHGSEWANDRGRFLADGFTALARLIPDLKTTEAPGGGSMLDKTTILSFSEFTRTARLNQRNGHHHNRSNCAFVAGAGIKPGVRQRCGSHPDRPGDRPGGERRDQPEAGACGDHGNARDGAGVGGAPEPTDPKPPGGRTRSQVQSPLSRLGLA